MQMIKDLMDTPEGRRFLEDNGITPNPEVFVAQLDVPRNPLLQQYLGTGKQKPVYTFQQIYVDVTQSMLDRIQLLAQLERDEEVDPFFLWIDTDRAGSDKITTRIYWPHWGKVQSIPICPHAVRDIESRFVELETAQLAEACEKLGMYLVQSVSGSTAREAAEQRFGSLKDLFVLSGQRMLSEFNHRLTYFLLAEYAGLNPASVTVSDLAEQGILTAEVEAMLNQIEPVIRVFNQARDELIRREINPVVKPLADDYLPLNYSCLACQRRLRLRREMDSGDQFAAARCRCGETYRFYLGARDLSIAELAQTGRWSPDVSLALLMNDLVSGFVGGQSSGVYFGLLMQAALEKVLSRRRVPVLLPSGMKGGAAQQFDSLIYRYLTEVRLEPRVLEMAR